MPDFSEILREEAVFNRILAMGHIYPRSTERISVFLMKFGLRRAAAFRIFSDTLVITSSQCFYLGLFVSKSMENAVKLSY